MALRRRSLSLFAFDLRVDRAAGRARRSAFSKKPQNADRDTVVHLFHQKFRCQQKFVTRSFSTQISQCMPRLVGLFLDPFVLAAPTALVLARAYASHSPFTVLTPRIHASRHSSAFWSDVGKEM